MLSISYKNDGDDDDDDDDGDDDDDEDDNDDILDDDEGMVLNMKISILRLTPQTCIQMQAFISDISMPEQVWGGLNMLP